MSEHPFRRRGRRPLVLGHRGLPLLFQENSLSGFRACLARGLDGVELDVFLTKDEKVVVFHDQDLRRLTGVARNIHDLTWDELSKLRIQRRVDMGERTVECSSEEPIPLLEDVLDEFQGKLLMNIELKAYDADFVHRRVGAEVGKILRAKQAEGSVIVTSFSPFMLHELHQENPDAFFGFCWDDDTFKGLAAQRKRFQEYMHRAHPERAEASVRETVPSWLMERMMRRLMHTRVVGMEHTLIRRHSVERAHARGLAVGAYTVFPLDTRFEAERQTQEQQERELLALVEKGVDWIETDDAPRVMALLQRSSAQPMPMAPEQGSRQAAP